MRARFAPALLATAVLVAGGCGGDGDELVEEGPLRDCLVEAGLTLEPPDLTAGVGLGNASPDFRMTTAEGTPVDLIVQGDDKKAKRTAADVQGARATLGGPSGEVLVRDNAVAVFEDTPSDASRQAVEECLGARG